MGGYKLFLSLLVWTWSITHLNGQVQIGIATRINASYLSNINKNEIVPFGYSGAKFNQRPTLEFNPIISARKLINDNLGVEIGLGYFSRNHKLELDYYYSFFQMQVNKTLNISLNYINIPISIIYNRNIKPNSKVVISGEIAPSFLIEYKDNFQEIILEKIYLLPDKYRKFTFASNISLGFQKNINKNIVLELSCFGGLNFLSINKKESQWGFYNNLYHSRTVLYGISIKSFFFNL